MLSHSTRLAIEQCNRDIRSLEQLLSETKISESQIRLDFFARKNPWERFQRLNEAATNTVLGMVGENSIQKQQFEAAFEKLLIAPRDRKDKIENNINIAIAAI